MTWTFRGAPLLVAGPCVVESGDTMPRVAERLAGLGLRLGIPVCFKASVDKANRARGDAPRGPGFEAGLRMLERVRRESGLPVLTDVHEPGQAGIAAEVADALQVPAFLCRQTDLLVAAGRTGRPVNIKKGQWMAPEAMAGAAEKVRAAGGVDLAVTERGTAFGYGDLVVDMRSFSRLRVACQAPVLFDATHAVQQPGQGVGGASGGQRDHIPALLLAAAAAGADGFFLETHPAPERAPSDAATQWPLEELESLVERALEVWHAARSGRGAATPGRRGAP
ncbi:MAG: 3-deoxy-8-phosphooctulonate synthase [Gemmatimonadales bacterium]